MIQQEDRSGKIETKEEYKYIECMSIVRMLYNFQEINIDRHEKNWSLHIVFHYDLVPETMIFVFYRSKRVSKSKNEQFFVLNLTVVANSMSFVSFCRKSILTGCLFV